MSLAGRVTRLDGSPAQGGQVRLTNKARADEWLPRRPIVADIRHDGRYFFLNLPPSEYTAGGIDDRHRMLEERDVVIATPKRGIRCLEFSFDLKAGDRRDGQ